MRQVCAYHITRIGVIYLLETSRISVFPIDSKPYGFTYGEWSAKWWQWLLSIPRPANPAFDSTGANANVGQRDPDVYFLCQTIEGVKGVHSRICSIQPGKAIFMPIINWVSILHAEGESDQQMIAIAKEKIDAVAKLEVSINGKNISEGLEKYRAHLLPLTYLFLAIISSSTDMAWKARPVPHLMAIGFS